MDEIACCHIRQAGGCLMMKWLVFVHSNMKCPLFVAQPASVFVCGSCQSNWTTTYWVCPKSRKQHCHTVPSWVL